MYPLNSHPDWVFKLLTTLCIGQVKEQLSDNLNSYPTNPPCFIFNGQLFAYTNSRLLIADEFETEFAMQVN